MGMLGRLVSSLSFVSMLVAPTVVVAQGGQKGSAFDFAFEAIDGKPMPLAGFKGRVLLIVNTASFCGFTRQYQGLQALWQRHEAAGLVVIGVPSNDFGEQEPKAESEIREFCEGAFGITFPLTAKQTVKGPGAHPFYAWARSQLGDAAAPRWNFHKYLVGRDGRLITAFGTTVAPEAKEIETAIAAALAQQP